MAFCHTCIQAHNRKIRLISGGNVDLAFISTGFRNWKDATRRFRAHQETTHKDAVMMSVTLPKTTRDVGESLSSQLVKEKKERREIFLKIISNIRFLARQGLALTGDGDESDSNFIRLFKLRGEDDSRMEQWLERKTDKYVSAEIQNEVLQLLALRWRNQWGPGGRLPLPKSYNGKGKAKNRGGKEESGNGNAEERTLKVQKSGRAKRELGDNREIDAQCVLEKVLSFLERVLREVVSKVQSSDFYTLMVDETPDVSNLEQVVICLRWVDGAFEVHEEFIGLYTTATTTADQLLLIIKDALLRMNLSLSKVRGQCYDGAAAMSGVHSGVATKLMIEELTATATPSISRAQTL
ncbi:putative zinc finger MYM-type protein 1-like [Apostichopus japonicus]|uniref:Putative zinc finger MYM-type protein 1-like n=1 Tax=Stichopus japonicus TaxID=307972 RepID=A0A2G8K3T2_STIJA|nr:putative zinc finger MYM-type protein 1-like [Apostichopus japonicus]